MAKTGRSILANMWLLADLIPATKCGHIETPSWGKHYTNGINDVPALIAAVNELISIAVVSLLRAIQGSRSDEKVTRIQAELMYQTHQFVQDFTKYKNQGDFDTLKEKRKQSDDAAAAYEFVRRQRGY